MHFRKVYGESKVEACPFCEKRAVIKNKQDIPVCLRHKGRELTNLKCMCGDWLDVRTGKWGPFFSCMRCGNVNFRRGLEMNPQLKEPEKEPTQKKEIVIRSDELDLYY